MKFASNLNSSRLTARAATRRVSFRQGHLPSKRLGIAPTSATLDELQQALAEAIQEEDYKQAAIVRDEIKSHPEERTSADRRALNRQLEEALRVENYEEAATIRDNLAKLPAEPSSKTSGDLTHKSSATTDGVQVKAISAYIPERSVPEKGQYYFVYKIQIENHSDRIVHLRNRKWSITDANSHCEEVKGPGVVGQQPILLPGKKFEYISACPLSTDTGSMEGEYECIVLDEEGEWGNTLMVKVAPFLLTTRVVGQMEA